MIECEPKLSLYLFSTFLDYWQHCSLTWTLNVTNHSHNHNLDKTTWTMSSISAEQLHSIPMSCLWFLSIAAVATGGVALLGAGAFACASKFSPRWSSSWPSWSCWWWWWWWRRMARVIIAAWTGRAECPTQRGEHSWRQQIRFLFIHTFRTTWTSTQFLHTFG